MNLLRSNRGLQTFVLGLFFTSSLMCPFLRANPAGEQVVAGTATFARSGSTLSVQTSAQTIIHWQDFSINSGEVTQFIQSSSLSSVLNRVVGGNLSSIYGTLQSNGQVYLINPNGIVIGPSGVINTAGFVASTLDVSNSDFLGGGAMKFLGNSPAKVQNFGVIEASGGDVLLISRQVENFGTIAAPTGTAGLYASDEVYLADGVASSDRGMVRLGAAGSGSGIGVANTGFIQAARAELKATGNLYALAINNAGVVRAMGTATKGGVVYLQGQGGTVQHSGDIVAKNADGGGGKVNIDSGAGGTTLITGRIDADASAANKAGGEVVATGDNVGLFGDAWIHARGSGQGGQVYIGGDYHGANPEIQNASHTYVGSQVSILADGGVASLAPGSSGAGNGGNVVIWSNQTTRYAGTISVRGGDQGGDGGMVEVSGKAYLNFQGNVVTLASNGHIGQLLLDPDDLVISVSADSNINAATPFSPSSNAPSILSTTTLQGALATSDVLVQTTFGGNITISNPINWSSGHSLTLNSGNNITVSSDIINLGTGNITLDAFNGIILGGNITTGGSIFLNADRARLGNNGSGMGTIQFTSSTIIDLTAGGLVSFSASDINAPTPSFLTIAGPKGIIFAPSTPQSDVSLGSASAVPYQFNVDQPFLSFATFNSSNFIYGRPDGFGVLNVDSSTIVPGNKYSFLSPGGTVRFNQSITGMGSDMMVNAYFIDSLNPIDLGNGMLTLISDGKIDAHSQEIRAGGLVIQGAGNVGTSYNLLNIGVPHVILQKSAGMSYLGYLQNLEISGQAGDGLFLRYSPPQNVSSPTAVTVNGSLSARGDIYISSGALIESSIDLHAPMVAVNGNVYLQAGSIDIEAPVAADLSVGFAFHYAGIVNRPIIAGAGISIEGFSNGGVAPMGTFTTNASLITKDPNAAIYISQGTLLINGDLDSTGGLYMSAFHEAVVNGAVILGGALYIDQTGPLGVQMVNPRNQIPEITDLNIQGPTSILSFIGDTVMNGNIYNLHFTATAETGPTAGTIGPIQLNVAAVNGSLILDSTFALGVPASHTIYLPFSSTYTSTFTFGNIPDRSAGSEVNLFAGEDFINLASLSPGWLGTSLLNIYAPGPENVELGDLVADRHIFGRTSSFKGEFDHGVSLILTDFNDAEGALLHDPNLLASSTNTNTIDNGSKSEAENGSSSVTGGKKYGEKKDSKESGNSGGGQAADNGGKKDDATIKPGETLSVDINGNSLPGTPPPALTNSLKPAVRQALLNAL